MAVSIDEFDRWWNDLTQDDLGEIYSRTTLRPQFLGNMDLFGEAQGLYGTFHKATLVQDHVQFLTTAVRGAPGQTRKETKSQGFGIEIPHIPVTFNVTPSDLANIDLDVKGSRNAAVSTAERYLAEQFQKLRDDAERTWEHHRCWAIQGRLKDADADLTEILNLFTMFSAAPFSLTETTHAITEANVLSKLEELERLVLTELGSDQATQIVVICGATLFANLRKSANLTDVLTTDIDKSFQRESYVYRAFQVRNITFVEARGKIGNGAIFPDNEGRVVLPGSGLYEVYDGTPYGMNANGMKGQEVYFTKAVLDHQEGLEVKAQFNRLHILKRPRIAIKVTFTP